MVNGVTFKVCGLTSASDAAAAVAAGADFLGFIFHPASPRHLEDDRFLRLRRDLPGVPRVAVCVAPEPARLARLAEWGFDAYQVHCDGGEATSAIDAWAGTVGRARLWLAPRLAPGELLPAAWLARADTFLLDSFHAGKFGGTGSTGDWAQFRRWAGAYPEKRWILAGGLTPENVAAARAETGARFLDVNSGVESAPGVKCGERLGALRRALELS